MDSKKAQQVLTDCLKKNQGLTEQLKEVGFVWPVSVLEHQSRWQDSLQGDLWNRSKDCTGMGRQSRITRIDC
ncbi:MAG: hypothetical protein WBI82_06845 [Sphaerochaeta sp.]